MNVLFEFTSVVVVKHTYDMRQCFAERREPDGLVAVLATTVVTVMAKGRDFEDGFGGYLEDHADGLVMVGLIVYTAIIVLCVGGLWMYHLRLLCENKTTNEDIKQTYDRYNPHDHGCCGNCSEVLCSKVRPSHFSAPAGSAEGP